VQIRSNAPQEVVRALTDGITSEGDFLRVAQVSLLRQGRSNAWLEIVLHEGKNRQIRRILGALGVEVLRLVRVAIGPLLLGTLAKGKVRMLSPLEKRALDPGHLTAP
jgi:23S rRNA pseudouridine2605 synthase